MHHLFIDLETFSDIDIGKAGLYKYAQSPAFQVLLFGYSLDGAPVQVVDLTQPGAYLPQEVLRWLFDRDCIKHAYNAAFEWYCLSRHFKLAEDEQHNGFSAITWLPQWSCSMLHGMYAGYPAGLDATGRALGLPEDKQKLTAGKALIRYFCVPCSPTKSNGGRTRNLPQHEPERWELFKTYNGQDVVAEMEIDRRLARVAVPETVQRQWELDQLINLRGVAVDMNLADGAIYLGETVKNQLLDEARRISGLENPNSVAQLTKWLQEETGEDLTDLRKDTVTDLLGKELPSEDARRMLEIRKELGKTSTKKYNAVETCVCADNRIRGLLQFYGANRTGREAGRLVQVQNLPHDVVPAAGAARELVRGRNLDALRLIYGSVTATLSALIRTVFVAAPGMSFIDADFSAIVSAFVYRNMGMKDFLHVLSASASSTASILFLVANAHIFSYLLSSEQIPQKLAILMTSLTTNPTMTMFLIMIVLLIAGCFLDNAVAVILLTPIFVNVVQAMNIDICYFGVFLVFVLAIGQVTPPVGLCLFVACDIGKVSIEKISREVLPYVGGLIVTAILLVLFPQIVT